MQQQTLGDYGEEMSVADVIEEELGLVELATIPPDELVEAIDQFVQAEALPENYLQQLSTAIRRHRADDFDMEPNNSAGKLEGKMHIRAQIRISFLLFMARVINFEVFENLRRENQNVLATKVYKYVGELEKMSQTFDATYKAELGVTQSPALSSSFWEGRESHPVDTARRAIADAYL